MPYTCGDLLILNDGLCFCYPNPNIIVSDIMFITKQSEKIDKNVSIVLDTKTAIFIKSNNLNFKDSSFNVITYTVLINGQIYTCVSNEHVHAIDQSFKKVT